MEAEVMYTDKNREQLAKYHTFPNWMLECLAFTNDPMAKLVLKYRNGGIKR